MNQVTNGNSSSNLTSANLANQTPASVSPVMGISPAAAFMDSATSGFVTLAQTLASLKKTDNETKLISANTLGQNINNKYQPTILDNQSKITQNQRKLSDFYSSEDICRIALQSTSRLTKNWSFVTSPICSGTVTSEETLPFLVALKDGTLTFCNQSIWKIESKSEGKHLQTAVEIG